MPLTSIRLPFGNGHYDFALPGEKLEEIERTLDIGMGAIYARTLKGRYPGGNSDDPVDGVALMLPDEAAFRFRDLKHIIHKALIGGGGGTVLDEDVRMNPTIADNLIRDYLLTDSDIRMVLNDIWKLAASILFVLMEGYTPPKKDEPAPEPAKRRTRAKS